MSETAPVTEEIKVETPNIFDEANWKSSPTIPESKSDDPVIADKDKKIETEKPTSDKPDDAEKIPTATPKPIQDKPAEEQKKPEAVATPESIKFANEESERVFNLLKEGKTDEVVSIYQEQKKLANADKLAPAEAIKLNLQYQNKDFTPQEINDLFNEQYEFPEKPVKGELDDEDEFKVIEQKYEEKVKKIEARIARDAKPAIAQLQKLQKEIVLPEINKGESKQNAPSQEELEDAKQARDFFFNDVAEGAKSFAGYNTTFKDEEVEIKVKSPVTEDDKKAMTPLLESFYDDLPKFMSEMGWTKDNKITGKLVEDLFLLQNKDKVFSKLVSEVGNKRIAEHIKSAKNIDYSGKQNNGGQMDTTEARKEFENTFFG